MFIREKSKKAYGKKRYIQHQLIESIRTPAGQGDLGLRPNFHHTDIPAIAHVHVSVLAYHILAGILKKLRTAGIHYNWNTICNILATHIKVTTTMNTEDGHVIDVRTCTTPTEEQQMVYNKLHIKHTPLGRKYIKSPMKPQRCSAEKWSAKIANY